jgi:hypothetical protein
LNKAQKEIVKAAKKRNIEVNASNQEESFRKSRIEVKRIMRAKKV